MCMTWKAYSWGESKISFNPTLSVAGHALCKWKLGKTQFLGFELSCEASTALASRHLKHKGPPKQAGKIPAARVSCSWTPRPAADSPGLQASYAVSQHRSLFPGT